MINTMSEYPLRVTASALGGAGVSTIEILTPPIQFAVLVGSLIVITLTAIIKFREVFKK